LSEDSSGGEAMTAKEHAQASILDPFEVFVFFDPEVGDGERILEFWSNECAVQASTQ
jgi:hypothetical protein